MAVKPLVSCWSTGISGPLALWQSRLWMCSFFVVTMLGQHIVWEETKHSIAVLNGVELDDSLWKGVSP
jgi:hypothetical protein